MRPACLAMIAGHYGYRTSLSELRQRFSVSLKGITANQLIRNADAGLLRWVFPGGRNSEFC